MNDEAEARQKRIESRRRAGVFFESTKDMKWLYFDLTLKGTFEDVSAEQKLEQLVRDTISASLWGRQDEVIKEAVSYVDCALFHCTVFRDFFIVQLLESMAKIVHPQPERKIQRPIVRWTVLGAVGTSAILWTFVNWWSAGLLLTPLILTGILKVKANDRRILRGFQWHAVNGIVEKVKRGGFHEQTIIEQLEMVDLKKSSHPVRLVIGDTPVPSGEVRPLDVPDVLYALLHLPRRNVQSEILVTLSALDERKRDELSRRWRGFLDPILTYDEPQVGPK